MHIHEKQIAERAHFTNQNYFKESLILDNDLVRHENLLFILCFCILRCKRKEVEIFEIFIIIIEFIRNTIIIDLKK